MIRKLTWVWNVIGGCFLLYLLILCAGCKAPIQHHSAAYAPYSLAEYEQVKLLMEREDAYLKISHPYDPCLFHWTFARRVKPIRSKEFILKRNHNGTITAWASCNPKFKRRV